MNIASKLFCRVFQIAFRAALPILPYREPKIVPSCSELGDVLGKEKSTSVLVVTDAGIVKNGLTISLENVLKKNKIKYAVYDKTQPNPTVDNVEEALALYHKNKCDTLIAIGGGSAMDCAKAVGARVAYPKRTLKQLGGFYYKPRGERRALETLVGCLEKEGFKTGKISIGHCQNESAAEQLKELILAKFKNVQIEIHKFRGLCSFYAEKGGILVGFEKA